MAFTFLALAPAKSRLFFSIHFGRAVTRGRLLDLQALLAPASLIASNAGVDGWAVVEKLLSSEWHVGYNAMTGHFEDLLQAGIVDPCKVSRCALQNAASIAGVVLMTQAVLVEKTRKPKPSVPFVPGITPTP